MNASRRHAVPSSSTPDGICLGLTGMAVKGAKTGERGQDGQRGGDLLIVDNSVSGWTGIRYLAEWTEYATSFDIATGYFEIGSLLQLDGQWQKLDKIRILMGADVSLSTRSALLAAAKSRAEAALDASLEEQKRVDPFLTGVAAV